MISRPHTLISCKLLIWSKAGVFNRSVPIHYGNKTTKTY